MQTFNQAQLKAIEEDGDMLIVAGPGTGKTHTLAHKIARIMERNPHVKAENVFAITFTTKAAKELRERISSLMKNSGAFPFVGTFHALCHNLIQHAYRSLGIAHPLHVIPEKDRRDLIASVCVGLDPQIKVKKIRDYEALISSMKNRLVGPEELKISGETGIFVEIFEQYEQALDGKKLVDFDDLIGKMVKLLQAHPHIKAAMNDALEWLFIDEYQDINGAQYQLIRSLVSPKTKICAIGDPDQAIYGFRGSDAKYFHSFEKDFPGTTVITLEDNYRSTPHILSLANELISHNPERKHGGLRAQSGDGPRVQLSVFEDEWKEAAFIVREVSKLVGGTDMLQTDAASGQTVVERPPGRSEAFHFADFAVLYRTKTQGRLITEAFKKAGIPYQTVSRVPWHQEAEIQMLLHCFQTLIDPNFKTGDHDTDFLCGHVSRIRNDIDLLKPAETATKIIELLRLDSPTESSTMMIEKRVQNLENFKALLHEFDALHGVDGLEKAVQYFGLLQDHDLYSSSVQAVSLMTIHAAKG
ncbi:MAG TPA: UvrD-helicase domain-containing protein, partial [Candidatus Gracilibacteria bacterium]|nr:UvrD-helicase domain-containing protein [Candidatus Gracilibacteria bacterium]